MAQVKFFKGLAANLPPTRDEDTFYLCTDTGDLYLGAKRYTGTGISEAPVDGKTYGRNTGDWVDVSQNIAREVIYLPGVVNEDHLINQGIYRYEVSYPVYSKCYLIVTKYQDSVVSRVTQTRFTSSYDGSHGIQTRTSVSGNDTSGYTWPTQDVHGYVWKEYSTMVDVPIDGKPYIRINREWGEFNPEFSSSQSLRIRRADDIDVRKMNDTTYRIIFPKNILNEKMRDWSDANRYNRPVVYAAGAAMNDNPSLSAGLASPRAIPTCGQGWMTTDNGYTVAFGEFTFSGHTLPACQLGFAWYIFLCGTQNPVLAPAGSIAYTFAEGSNWWVVVTARIGERVGCLDSVSSWVDVIQITDGSQEQIAALELPEITASYQALTSANPNPTLRVLLPYSGISGSVIDGTIENNTDTSNDIVFTVKSGADCCSGVSLTPEQLNAMAET
ncbi:MAG: hypothetical protein LBJ17_05390, partial [Dysgonamonadaceae bacterium]|nr:hypothetical protein [Dysgonamonadaceae bacterium]